MAVIGRPAPPSKLNASDIASNAITSAHIQSDALTHADLAPNSVTNSEMSDDAVGIAELSATGTAGATTFLRGDNTWTVVDTEGTGIKSTGEGGGSKFLREDGDGTSSWQVAGSPSISDGGNATALTIDSDEALTVNGSFKQLTNRNLSGTYSSHELFIADGYTLTGNITVNEDIALTKLSDDGASITLTTDGTSRTITGTGSIESSTLAQTPVTSVTGMTGTLGSGVTLDSPTGSLANSVTGSPALNLINTNGQIDNVQFPSGTVLQHKAMEITATISNAANGPTNEYVQSDGSYSTTFNGALTPLTLTTKRDNSWVLVRGSMHVYYTSSVASGTFCHSRMYLMYGTAGTGASTGNYTEYYAINNYQDCRSTNNVSGQEMDLVNEMVRVQLSVPAGTPVYFGMKVNRKHSGSEKGGWIEVMEIAA